MEAENPEPPNTEEPPKPKRGRPVGSENRTVNEAKDVAEATTYTKGSFHKREAAFDRPPKRGRPFVEGLKATSF